MDSPIVAELVAALKRLGCSTPDHAAAVLDAAPVRLSADMRRAVLDTEWRSSDAVPN